MAWEITCARKCTSILRWRIYIIFGFVKLRLGVTLVAIHTMIQGTLLFIPLFGNSDETSTKNIVYVPSESRLISGLMASPLYVTGISLLFASFRPRIGLLDGYVVGTQCVIVVFPFLFGVVYVRTYLETSNHTNKTNNGDDVHDGELFMLFIYLYMSLSYALISYALFFYNIILVLSYKDELLEKMKSAGAGTEDAYTKRLRELIRQRL